MSTLVGLPAKDGAGMGAGVALARIRDDRRRGVLGSEGADERLELPENIVCLSRTGFESATNRIRLAWVSLLTAPVLCPIVGFEPEASQLAIDDWLEPSDFTMRFLRPGIFVVVERIWIRAMVIMFLTSRDKIISRDCLTLLQLSLSHGRRRILQGYICRAGK